MLRWLYIQLIWLHPAPFRWRFGDQMLDIFDGAGRRAKLRYLADAVASLGRQWVLRPEFRRPDLAADATLATAGVPLFQTIETYTPHPAVLLQGGLLAILSITVAVLLIGKAGAFARPFLVGVTLSKPSLLPIDRDSLTGSELNTTVRLGAGPSEAWLKLARPYFASLPVLRTLDADPDLTLSPWEIATAPTALRRLDADYDGKLTAEECGLHINPNLMSTAALEQLRRRFMSFHPVLAALDADHDGEISAREIENAAAALKNLDLNHDGYLTADELIPVEMAARAGLR
jgi:EF hand